MTSVNNPLVSVGHIYCFGGSVLRSSSGPSDLKSKTCWCHLPVHDSGTRGGTHMSTACVQMPGRERKDLLDLMASKGLNIRTDTYEILLTAAASIAE